MKVLRACAWLLLSLPLAGAVHAGAREDGKAFNGVWQLSGKPFTQLMAADGQSQPLKPQARSLYEQRMAALRRGDTAFDPGMQCKPLGHPRLLWESGWPFDLQVTDERVLFGYTWNRLHRVVPVAAGQPSIVGPTYLGTAHATIRKGAIDIVSGGYNDATLLDAAGMPHGPDMTLQEHWALGPNGNTLQLQLHVTDPATFTRPWTARLEFQRVPNGRIREDVCQVRLGLYKEP